MPGNGRGRVAANAAVRTEREHVQPFTSHARWHRSARPAAASRTLSNRLVPQRYATGPKTWEREDQRRAV